MPQTYGLCLAIVRCRVYQKQAFRGCYRPSSDRSLFFLIVHNFLVVSAFVCCINVLDPVSFLAFSLATCFAGAGV